MMNESDDKVTLARAALDHLLHKLDESQALLREYDRRISRMNLFLSVIVFLMLVCVVSGFVMFGGLL